MKVQDLFFQAADRTSRRANAQLRVLSKKPLVLRLNFPDGIAFSTFGTLLPLNSRVDAALMVDKRLKVSELETEGLATPRTHFIPANRKLPGTRNHLRKSIAYKRIRAFIKHVHGYPVFVKPNKGSQGRDVFRVDSDLELQTILTRVVANKRREFIVQEANVGEEYRIIAIGGEIMLALRKQPLSITGDGKQNVGHLVEARLQDLRARGRSIKIDASSPKITSYLTKQGLSSGDVIEQGREIIILANKNLSDGAMPVVCTKEIREKYSTLCADIHKKFNLEYYGLDLMEDTRREPGRITPSIIEINGNPGFSHFIKTGELHQEMVRQVFVKAFERTYDVCRARRPDLSHPSLLHNVKVG